MTPERIAELRALYPKRPWDATPDNVNTMLNTLNLHAKLDVDAGCPGCAQARALIVSAVSALPDALNDIEALQRDNETLRSALLPTVLEVEIAEAQNGVARLTERLAAANAEIQRVRKLALGYANAYQANYTRTPLSQEERDEIGPIDGPEKGEVK